MSDARYFALFSALGFCESAAALDRQRIEAMTPDAMREILIGMRNRALRIVTQAECDDAAADSQRDAA